MLAAERLEHLTALRALLGQQDGRAQRGGPGPTLAAEQTGERLAHLGRAERLLGEERQLPAVERLAELAILVGEDQPLEQVGRELGTQLVEPGRITPRLRGGDRQERRDEERP